MILVRIALRNLWLHKFKTAIVGMILLLGTALVVVGNSVLDTLDKTMAIAIVNSVSGHLQVYSSEATDEFEIFRGFDSSTKDIGSIEDFERAKEVLEAVDNVRTVVPMGMNYAVVFTGNILDRRLGELRAAVDSGDETRAETIVRHIRRIVRVLDEELKNLADVADMEQVAAQGEDNEESLERVRQESFWAEFDTDPYAVLEFLENKISKLALGEDLLWLNYIATDTDLFQETFDRFEIVQGTPIPSGQRGFLFNERVYQRLVKNKTARRLDQIAERLDDGELFEECEDCSTWVSQNVKQAASLVSQMDDEAAATCASGLRAYLNTDESDLVTLLQSLLEMNASNFRERFDVFQSDVAPHIILYTVNIGDTLVLTGYGRGGYVRKVPVKVYGTFRFRSLDRSPLAGGFNVMDMMTFRDLYGFMTDEKLAEIAEIRADVGVVDVDANSAEDELFGGEDSDPLVQTSESTTFEPMDGLEDTAEIERYTEDTHTEVYTAEQINRGVVLNAAIMLEDGERLEETMADIESAIQEHGLKLRVITWRKASGIVGEFIGVVRIVLYAAVIIIFIVALVIINNSMMMSTMERIREIGTMRAIGAQTSFVRWMILLETGVLAVLFGGGGAALGAGVVLLMEHYGVGAWNNITYFLFAGPRLHPELLPAHLVIAFVVITSVGIASTFYPALLATRVTPREAMAKED